MLNEALQEFDQAKQMSGGDSYARAGLANVNYTVSTLRRENPTS